MKEVEQNGLRCSSRAKPDLMFIKVPADKDEQEKIKELFFMAK